MGGPLVIGLVLPAATPARADEPKRLKLEKTIAIEGALGRLDYVAIDSIRRAPSGPHGVGM